MFLFRGKVALYNVATGNRNIVLFSFFFFWFKLNTVRIKSQTKVCTHIYWYDFIIMLIQHKGQLALHKNTNIVPTSCSDSASGCLEARIKRTQSKQAHQWSRAQHTEWEWLKELLWRSYDAVLCDWVSWWICKCSYFGRFINMMLIIIWL